MMLTTATTCVPSSSLRAHSVRSLSGSVAGYGTLPNYTRHIAYKNRNVLKKWPQVVQMRIRHPSSRKLHTLCTADDARDGPVEKERNLQTVPQQEIDWKVLWGQCVKVAKPYWTTSTERKGALLRFGGLLGMTLATTGISVGFNFLGRDFFNAIAEKQPDEFQRLLVLYVSAIAAGVPVFVVKGYFQDRLALRWRQWMTGDYLDKYFADRTFYRIQAGSLIDNPDQRINDDISNFTSTALGFALVLFNSGIDLASFSGILFSIYPPLFAVLVVYAIGGTFLSVKFGESLVGLNFEQERREANFRFSLVRVRENAESIAFYGGEQNEMGLLKDRFLSSLENLGDLLIASRNLDFFTSYYRYLISVLPAAVVAPLYFRGDIEFGVINQSSSAFSHILSDFSLVVYQFQNIASFAAVTERLAQFDDTLEPAAEADADDSEEGSSSEAAPSASPGGLVLVELDQPVPRPAGDTSTVLLQAEHLTLNTPGDSAAMLVSDLNLAVEEGRPLMIMGPSGSGKTSLLRALAGLWTAGEGLVQRVGRTDRSPAALPEAEPEAGAPAGAANGAAAEGAAGAGPNGADVGTGGAVAKPPMSVFFVPQRPYMVLGSLRQQLLYPTWMEDCSPDDSGASMTPEAEACVPPPSDAELEGALARVQLGDLCSRAGGLGATTDWASVLSLGEQQRLAFARLLLAKPDLALLDESTSALDSANEALLYSELARDAITFVSVGHRPALLKFHKDVLFLRGKGGAGQPGAQPEAAAGSWEIVPTEVAIANYKPVLEQQLTASQDEG